MNALFIRIGLAAVIAVFGTASVRGDEHEHHAPPKSVPGQSMPFAQLDAAGVLHVVYVDSAAGVKTVRYKKMFAGEQIESTISSPQEILSHWPESPPKVAVTTDGTIHVLYTVRLAREGAVDLNYTASRDGGKTWSAAESVGEKGLEVYRSCAAISEARRLGECARGR